MPALPKRSSTQPLTWPFTELRSEPRTWPTVLGVVHRDHGTLAGLEQRCRIKIDIGIPVLTEGREGTVANTTGQYLVM